jgi:CubicO group peptidase (beta-lactamase class C family)
LVEADRFSGVVLITRAGRPLVSVARGLASYDPPVPNDIDTRFELASVSKMFTAVAIARLVEEGRLSFDSRVGDLLPHFPGRADIKAVTIRQLLSHTSGLSDYYRNGAIFADFRARPKLAEYWPLFASHPLEFKPGTEYSYSNSNYALLGSVIEHVSRMPFTAFVQREVFDRAGMKSSCYCNPVGATFAQPRSKHTAFAGPTRRPIRDGWILIPKDLPRPAVSAGYSLSTAPDLARFGRALLDGRLLRSATLSQMRRGVMSMEDSGKIGLGFFLYDVGGVQAVGHSGSSWGVRTQVDFYPAMDLAVIVLSNSETSGAEALKYKTREWLAALLQSSGRNKESADR